MYRFSFILVSVLINVLLQINVSFVFTIAITDEVSIDNIHIDPDKVRPHVLEIFDFTIKND